MSNDPNGANKGIYERELPDPSEDAKPWPKLLGVVLVGMTVWGVGYFLTQSGGGEVDGGDLRSPVPAPAIQAADGDVATTNQPSADAASQKPIDGKTVYETICQACHQAGGEGLPGVFPPLAGSEWLTSDIQTPIRIVLSGLSGPLSVKGAEFNGVMPGFAGQLTDAEIAAVLTYERSSFGNSASSVSPEDVAKERAAASGRTEPWTAKELRP